MVVRQARSLTVLEAEVDALAPDRSRRSDGGIGDPDHSSRVSDHNPNAAGVWRARDFTHDPAGGLDCHRLAAALEQRIREGNLPALGSGAYLIWHDRILSTDRLDEGWRPYSGANPHRAHLHVSVAAAASGYDDTRPWRLAAAYVPEENDDMPTPAELWTAKLPEVDTTTDATTRTAAQLLAQAHNRAGAAYRTAQRAEKQLERLEADLDRLEVGLLALATAISPKAGAEVRAALKVHSK